MLLIRVEDAEKEEQHPARTTRNRSVISHIKGPVKKRTRDIMKKALGLRVAKGWAFTLSHTPQNMAK